MADRQERTYDNRRLPARAQIAGFIERWLLIPFNLLELIGSYLLVRPTQFFMRRLDFLSYKLDGTWLKTLLQHTLFPVTLIATLYIGFKFVENGFTIASLAAFALIPIVYGLIFAPIERLMPFSRNWLEDDNGPSVDIMMFFSGVVWSGISKYLLSALFLIQLVTWLEPYGHQIWPSDWNLVVQVFLFLLIKDFFRYWYHRWMHEVPFMWRWHAVHHSVERLYWLNGIRSHPLEIIVQTLMWAVPLALLQPGPDIILVSTFMALSIGIFQHSNIDLKLGVWEYIFSIGDNHRYHHYPDKEVGDSNYGGEFIVWDILFGTFHKVKGERPHDRIGIGTSPNYPQTWAGLMLAPFLPDQKVFGAIPPQEETNAAEAKKHPRLHPAE